MKKKRPLKPKKVRQYPLPSHVEEALKVAKKRVELCGSKDLARKVRHALPSKDIRRMTARRKAQVNREQE